MRGTSRILQAARWAVVVGLSAGPATAQPPGANYDEAKVPAYTLPDPLRFADGTLVRDARDWTDRRRAEVLRLFEAHVYGRSPGAARGAAVRRRRDRPARPRRPRHAPAGAGPPRRHRDRSRLRDPALRAERGVPSRPGVPRAELRRQPYGPPGPGDPALEGVDARGPGGRGSPRDRGRRRSGGRLLAGRADPRPRLRPRHGLLRRPRARPRRRVEGRRALPASARERAAASDPTTGGRSAPGPGASAGRSTSWRRTPTWTGAASP